ncbi:MAG: hypothetical protein POELPBGB_01454 [Bacteroidia bacterium]|nr:hypothetical protein [Bacteroidia bacterium]
MKKITAEEAAAIAKKPVGRITEARALMLNMKPGEFIFISHAEWKWKSKPPSAICRELEKHSTLKFKCDKALDGSGWVVERQE